MNSEAPVSIQFKYTNVQVNCREKASNRKLNLSSRNSAICNFHPICFLRYLQAQFLLLLELKKKKNGHSQLTKNHKAPKVDLQVGGILGLRPSLYLWALYAIYHTSNLNCCHLLYSILLIFSLMGERHIGRSMMSR